MDASESPRAGQVTAIRRAVSSATHQESPPRPASIVADHLVSMAEESIAGPIMAELSASGVVEQSSGLFSLSWRAYTLVLTVLALGARAAITDVDLQLTTTMTGQSQLGPALVELGAPRGTVWASPDFWPEEFGESKGTTLIRARSLAQLLDADLRDVGIDLSRVPLDEVLDFRAEHGEHYRAYRVSIQLFDDLEVVGVSAVDV
jgi:hypothetical protein